MTDLAKMNSLLEAGGHLPASVWKAWLWETDPEEPCKPQVLLNRNQLTGLLVCRSMVGKSKPTKPLERMDLMDKPVKEMTHSELRDTINNMQLEWREFVDNYKEPMQVKNLVDACASRCGELVSGFFGLDVLDDPGESEPGPGDKAVMTVLGMRRLVVGLFMLYRHVFLLAYSELLECGPAESQVKHFHHEASMSDFYEWSMHFSLPVGAKLQYKHDFPGMYNHVSQPVYFHNPSYVRIGRHSLENDEPIHMIPSLCQLYPELRPVFEEESFDPTKKDGPWRWLIVSGRVYLMGRGMVYYSRSALVMLSKFLSEKN